MYMKKIKEIPFLCDIFNRLKNIFNMPKITINTSTKVSYGIFSLCVYMS
jgi:hypothetical protein